MKQEIKDLENFNDGEWGDDNYPLKYNDMDLFKFYMDNYNKIQNSVHEHISLYNDIVRVDSQEVYLGYNKKTDTFVSGWDCWITEMIEDEDDEDNEYEDDYNGYTLVYFKIEDGEINITEDDFHADLIFYNSNPKSGYNYFKRAKNIIDIRLD